MKKKLVIALLASCMVCQGAVGSTALAMDADQYVDVKKTDNFFEYIEKVTDEGIMDAEKDGEFGVETKMTRGDVIDTLWKLAGKPAKNYTSKFEDAKNVDAVTMAEDLELFDGLPDDFFTDGKFEADKELTREEFAVILYNYAKADKLIEMDTDAVADETILDAFDDKDQVDDWSKTAVKWNIGYTFLVAVGEDAEKNELKIDETVTKGQVAEAVAKYMSEVEKVEAQRYFEETVNSENKGNGNAGTNSNKGNSNKGTSSKGNSNKGNTSKGNGDATVDEGNGNGGNAGNSGAGNGAGGNTGNAGNTGNSGNTGNTDQGTGGDKEPEEHVHKFVPKYDWVHVDEQEGYWYDKLVKEAYDEVIKHDEVGHMEQQLVKEAWDEIVKHPEEGHMENQLVSPEEGHFENQLVKEAWDEVVKHPEEGHYEDVLIKEAWDEVVHHDAEYEKQWVVDKEAWEETVHHDAVYENKWVVDKEAWTETVNHPEEGHYEDVVVTPAWDEPVYETQIHWVCKGCGHDFTANGEGQADIEAHIKNHFMTDGTMPGYTQKEVQVQVDTIHHPAVTEKKWIVDQEAWTETINHPEEGHYEDVLVSEAWDEIVKHPEEGHYEDVLIKEAWDETIHHEAEYEQQWVVDKEAWEETIHHEAEYEEVWVVDKEAVYEEVWVVDKEAWEETIHHEAEYEDVWVVDQEAWEETIHHEAEYEKTWMEPVAAHEEWGLVGFECEDCHWVVGGPKNII